MIFEVGKTAPSPFWPVGIDDSGVFVTGDDGGLAIALYMGNISQREAKAVAKGPIEARYIDGGTGLMLTLIRFRDVGLIFELPYDPGKGKKAQLGPPGAPLVTCLSIDTSNSGRVCTIRTVTPPEKLLSMWRLRWNEPSTGTAQDDFLVSLYQDDIEALWEKATPAGTWGKG